VFAGDLVQLGPPADPPVGMVHATASSPPGTSTLAISGNANSGSAQCTPSGRTRRPRIGPERDAFGGAVNTVTPGQWAASRLRIWMSGSIANTVGTRSASGAVNRPVPAPSSTAVVIGVDAVSQSTAAGGGVGRSRW